MNVKRYDLGTVYQGSIGAPGIIEYPGGRYVLASDYDVLVGQMEAVGAGGVSPLMGAVQDADKTDARNHDDIAVDAFASAMKAKLAKKRNEGRGGWQDKQQCSAEFLSELLRGHIGKGDPVDVANLAMMLHQRGESITLGDVVSAQPDPAMAGDEWLIEISTAISEYVPSRRERRVLIDLARKRVQPASGEDAKNAARWRYLLKNPYRAIDLLKDGCDFVPAHWTHEANAAIDAAMQQGGV